MKNGQEQRLAQRNDGTQAGAAKQTPWAKPQFRIVPLSLSETGIAAGPDAELLHS
jgi:hypothetical protein